MGARMTTGYLAENPDSGVAGYLGVGLLGGGEPPLNANANPRQVKIPVIGMYAESSNDAKFAGFQKAFVSDRHVQIPVPGAQHDLCAAKKRSLRMASNGCTT